VEIQQDNPSKGALQNEPFWHLLYRYFWPFPYFRDVTRGVCMERQQNYRHNRAMRVHLPGFVFKWVALTALCFFFGMTLGNVPAPVALTACFFVTGSWTLVVSVLLLTAWCWLERFPELY
jgi:hypothetical protein